MGKQIFKFTKTTQTAILQRDKHTCGLCPKPANDHPHHCFYGTHRPKGFDSRLDDVSDWWNGTAICDSCHYGIHHGTKQPNGNTLKENRDFLEAKAQRQFDELSSV